MKSSILPTSLVLGLALAASLAGCRVTEVRSPTFSDPGSIRRGLPSRVWTVIAGGEYVGEVVLFESPDHPQDSFHMVRNIWQQDLGIVDSLGRAYRYLPHRDEPAWVCTGTLAQGVAGILGLDVPCELVEEEDLLPPDGPPEEG